MKVSPLRRPAFNRFRRRPSPRSGVALLVALALAAAWTWVKPFFQAREEGQAIVIDGDSLRIGAREFRLQGIDAPELGQDCAGTGRPIACGRLARRHLVELIGDRPVTCRIEGEDRYGRALALCRAGGDELNAAMVAAGHAIAYGGYEREEAAAREQRLGLWAGRFERPDDWRRRHAGEP